MTQFNAGPAVVIVSCCAYADLWRPLHRALKKFWPDCPYQRYLVTDKVPQGGELDLPGWEIVATGHSGWSGNLATGLREVRGTHSHAFLWLDDLFPVAPVAGKRLEDLASFAVANAWSYVRFASGLPPPTKEVIPFSAGPLPAGDQYRNSVVMSFWDIDRLLQILHPDESAWQFETRGAARSDSDLAFYSCDEPLVRWVNCVIKGKWDPRALDKVIRVGVISSGEVYGSRSIMSKSDLFLQRFRELRSYAFTFVPRHLRRAVHLRLTQYH